MWRKDQGYENVKIIKRCFESTNGKCPSCGQKLSTSEFSLDVEKK